MFKKIMNTGLVLSLLMFVSLSVAAEKGYKNLASIQPIEDTSKVEVIEFFGYGCPHCYKFDPILEEWKAKLPENVTFIRQPVVFNPVWAKHAKAYFAAQELDVLDKVHADFFRALHVEGNKLSSDAALAQFFAAHGVEKEAFQEAYNSFFANFKLNQAKSMPPRYGITGVPAVVVNGKYLVNGKTAGSHENIIKVINELIAQESK